MIDNPQPGSGTLVDWSVIDPHAVSRRWILAGGLSPDNVAGAIEQLKPWGVDASSGLESAPGVKDRELLQSFIVNAKQAGAP